MGDTSLVLGVLVHESLSGRSKLPELRAHHVVGDLDLDVFLAVVDLEAETDKLRQNVTQTGVGTDGGTVLDGVGKRKRHNVRALPRQAFEQRNTRSHYLGWRRFNGTIKFWRSQECGG